MEWLDMSKSGSGVVNLELSSAQKIAPFNKWKEALRFLCSQSSAVVLNRQIRTICFERFWSVSLCCFGLSDVFWLLTIINYGTVIFLLLYNADIHVIIQMTKFQTSDDRQTRLFRSGKHNLAHLPLMMANASMRLTNKNDQIAVKNIVIFLLDLSQTFWHFSIFCGQSK